MSEKSLTAQFKYQCPAHENTNSTPEVANAVSQLNMIKKRKESTDTIDGDQAGDTTTAKVVAHADLDADQEKDEVKKREKKKEKKKEKKRAKKEKKKKEKKARKRQEKADADSDSECFDLTQTRAASIDAT